MCSLVHTCDDEKRLRFMNPTQINQLELNPVINEKSETFKGMSNKKRHAAIKSTIKTDQTKKEILHQPTYVNYCNGSKTDNVSWPPITSSKLVLSYDQLYLMNYNINMFVCLYNRH
jgi:hypothetical protein